MPRFVYIIAVEIVEDRIFSEDFTPLIQTMYEKIYNEVKDITRKIISK